jgi:hypothetical protein
MTDSVSTTIPIAKAREKVNVAAQHAAAPPERSASTSAAVRGGGSAKRMPRSTLTGAKTKKTAPRKTSNERRGISSKKPARAGRFVRSGGMGRLPPVVGLGTPREVDRFESYLRSQLPEG